MFASLWQRPADNGATVFLVNPTREQMQVEVGINAEECAAMTVGEPLQGGMTLLEKSLNPPAFTLVLPPLSVVVVPLSKS